MAKGFYGQENDSREHFCRLNTEIASISFYVNVFKSIIMWYDKKGELSLSQISNIGVVTFSLCIEL